MTRQIVLRPPSSIRRQPLLINQSSSASTRFAEVAGGTTAECAAICCCCPCGLVNLLFLAVYKLPAGLCRRALRKKKRQRLIKKGLIQPRLGRCSCGCDETEFSIHPVTVNAETEFSIHPVTVNAETENKTAKAEEDSSEKEAMELEKEMWDKFYNTGFWRSPSQRE